MKLLALAVAAGILAGCQPIPPCPDEACVIQRQQNAMMLLGIMARQQDAQSAADQQYQQQQQQQDLQFRLDDLQGQVDQLRANQP